MKCYSWTLDTVGLFAVGVEDLALALAAVTGRPELAEYRFTKPLHIGVVTQDFADPAEAASDAARRIAAIAAERAGASIRMLTLGSTRHITTRSRRGSVAARLDG
ncbi:hypothetical protein IVB04_24370 [Bradyrhizobium sp. 169]|nr:hypothetical protein [Bradyrhizobium sp. 169]